ncbi:MAG: hypothetical protein ACK5D5_07640 [Bacteroidota bacterium]|jgi:hypothetical protein
MKKLFFVLFAFLSINFAIGQAKSGVSNHVFLMCDQSETPLMMYGQAFYIVLHNNGKVQMICGKDLSSAISNGPTKSGTWSASGSNVWWTWSDGKRSEDWKFNSYSNNLSTGSSVLKDMGKF